jgi:uncharacterized metal-binding protein YceD (DUF177 family)
MNSIGRPPLSRPIKVEEIGEGRSGKIEATEAEMEAIASLLDLAGLTGLSFSYKLRHAGGERLSLTGILEAEVTQTCVVTLEPVASHLKIPVATEFWPHSLVEELEQKEEDPAHAALLDWPEAVMDGRIDLGPLIYETLATGLDPYPKRQGASFDWSHTAPETAAEGESGPFAALAKLKSP